MNCQAVPNRLTTSLWTFNQEAPFHQSFHLRSRVSEQNFQQDTMSIQQASRHRCSPQVLHRKGWKRHQKRSIKFSGLCTSAIDNFKSLQTSETLVESLAYFDTAVQTSEETLAIITYSSCHGLVTG